MPTILTTAFYVSHPCPAKVPACSAPKRPLAVQVLTEFASAYGARPADDKLAEEAAAGDVSAITTLFLYNQR